MRIRQHFSKYLMVLMILLFAVIADSRGNSWKDTATQQDLNERMAKIIFPAIDLKNKSIPSILTYFSKMSKQYDPKGRGVNIVLSYDSRYMKSISINFKNKSLGELINYICKTNGLKYKLDNNVVVIYENDEPSFDSVVLNKTLNNSVINKLNNITIPKLILTDVSLVGAVNDLCRISKRFDPDKVGINFFALLQPPFIAKPGAIKSDRRFQNVRINMMSSQSLRQIVRYICLSSGTKYMVQNNAVIITRKNIKTLPFYNRIKEARGRIHNIIFPISDFENASLHSIFKYLSKMSKRYDSKHKGIDMILCYPLSYLGRISMKAAGMPLDYYIHYICQVVGLKYKLENNAVIIYKNDDPDFDIFISNQMVNAPVLYQLDNIIIPKLIFAGVSLQAAINHLNRISKQLDPAGIGVKFYLPADMNKIKNENMRISIRMLSKHSLGEIIRYTCLAAGVKYGIKDNTVVVTRKNINIEELKLKEMPK